MKLKEEFIEICEEYFGLSPSNVWDERVKESAANELLALFEKAMDEVIGKDDLSNHINQPRNWLRIEMRKKVKEMTNQQTDKEKV